jgi:lauroyl/myristoyl acyltransferase
MRNVIVIATVLFMFHFVSYDALVSIIVQIYQLNAVLYKLRNASVVQQLWNFPFPSRNVRFSFLWLEWKTTSVV